MTGENGKYNYSEAAHLYPPFSDIPFSAKNYKIASALTGNTDKEPPKAKDKRTMEVEAESVSFAVCQYYGIDTSANSLGYIATWSKDKSLPELKASLETITKTVSGLISAIDRHFAEICKERGIDLTAQPEQAAPAAELPDTPERFVSDMFTHMQEMYEAQLISDPLGNITRNEAETFYLKQLSHGEFSGVYDLLDSIQEQAATPTMQELLDRLEKLELEWDAGLSYEIKPYIPDSSIDRFYLEASRQADDGFRYNEVIFTGSQATCTELKQKLEEKSITARAVRDLGGEDWPTPEQKYVYEMKATGIAGQSFIEVQQRNEQDTPLPGEVLFCGTNEVCAALLDQLNNGTLQQEDFFTVAAARISPYTTRDGAELDALVGPDDKVYLGRRDHYDNRGHYLNNDHSLMHISDNDRVFDVISGVDRPRTQEELQATGYFTQEELENFSALPLHTEDEPSQTAPPIPPPEQADEALYLLDDSVYLHIQASDEGWDYTLYTKYDMAQIDGGQLDAPGLSITGVVEHIRKAEEIGTLAVAVVSLEVLEELRDHADHALAAETPQPEQGRDYAGELREHFTQEDAALLDTALDEYPMPDSTLTLDDLAELGYSETDLLPLSRDRGAELVDRDMTVYMVRTGENPEMVFDREDLMEQPEGVMFAIPREEWETSQDFQQAVADRIDRQEDRERAFLDHSGDCFAIYQVKLGDEESLRDIRHESLEWIQSKGRTVERGNYDLAYTAPLSEVKSADAALERLWYMFNNEHPADYQRPSMSVSDIIAIRLDGVLSFHYCDSYGFKQLPDFIQPEDYLKNAEMAMEDDLGMIDGIINNGPKEGPSVAELEAQVKAGQTISLMDLAEAVKREKGEKKSVLAKLNAAPPQQNRKKTAPKKSAERER